MPGVALPALPRVLHALPVWALLPYRWFACRQPLVCLPVPAQVRREKGIYHTLNKLSMDVTRKVGAVYTMSQRSGLRWWHAAGLFAACGAGRACWPCRC